MRPLSLKKSESMMREREAVETAAHCGSSATGLKAGVNEENCSVRRSGRLDQSSSGRRESVADAVVTKLHAEDFKPALQTTA